jgi:hypothetical protein
MTTFKQRQINVIYWLLITLVALLVSEIVRLTTFGSLSTLQRFPSGDVEALSAFIGFIITFLAITQYLATGEIKVLFAKIVTAVLVAAIVIGTGRGLLDANDEAKQLAAQGIASKSDNLSTEGKLNSDKPFRAETDCPDLLKKLLDNPFADLVPHYKECTAAGYLPEGFVLDKPANTNGHTNKCDSLRGNGKPWLYYQCLKDNGATR